MAIRIWVSVLKVPVDQNLHRPRRNIMRDNMIVNMSGHAGKGTGMDMNIEHLIRNDKVCLAVELKHCIERVF